MGHVILGLLMLLGPQTLYSLNKQFERGPSLFYRASFGSLQSALRGLLAALPTGTFPGVDQTEVYQFLEAHAPRA